MLVSVAGLTGRDELKQVPDQLDAFIADKRFLQAALLLQQSIKKSKREVLHDVGALTDLRQYFVSQENVRHRASVLTTDVD